MAAAQFCSPNNGKIGATALISGLIIIFAELLTLSVYRA
jgi:hypothetical protein